MFKFFYCQFHKVSNKHQLQIFITLNKNKRSNLFKKSLRLFCFYKIKIVPLIPTPPFYKPPYNQNNKNHQSPSHQITIFPFKLRHNFEIHSPYSHNKSKWYKYGRNNRQLLHNPIHP